jgi:cytochrome c-type biogenesis protein CcmE
MLPFKKNHYLRLKKVVYILIIPLCSCYLFVTAFNEHLHLYLTPSEFLEKRSTIIEKKTFQIGGLVTQGSLKKNNKEVTFNLSDKNNKQISIHYSGSLPSLFKEGQGAVIEAYLDKGQLYAKRVYVKHDENYSPPKANA